MASAEKSAAEEFADKMGEAIKQLANALAELIKQQYQKRDDAKKLESDKLNEMLKDAGYETSPENMKALKGHLDKVDDITSKQAKIESQIKDLGNNKVLNEDQVAEMQKLQGQHAALEIEKSDLFKPENLPDMKVDQMKLAMKQKVGGGSDIKKDVGDLKQDTAVEVEVAPKIDDTAKVGENPKVEGDTVKVDEKPKLDDTAKVDEKPKLDDSLDVGKNEKVDNALKVDSPDLKEGQGEGLKLDGENPKQGGLKNEQGEAPGKGVEGFKPGSNGDRIKKEGGDIDFAGSRAMGKNMQNSVGRIRAQTLPGKL